MDIYSKIKSVPKKPGVYLMKNHKGDVLYVGKAKNLKSRVSSYFNKSIQPSPKTKALVEKVMDLEVIVVEKEIEALILENELIKKYRPPFNVLMRDDKNYLYIRVGQNDSFPTISFVRRSAHDGAKYFGPYVDSKSARRAVQLLQRILPICTAKKVGRACLNYHIGRCPGVCVGEMGVEEYRPVFDQVVSFLSGNYKDVLQALNQKMDVASKKKDFEKAARLRDGIVAIKKIAESQSVVSPTLRQKIDVIGFDTRANRSVVVLMQVRSGKILNQISFVMESNYETEQEEILSGFIRDYYAKVSDIPNLVLVPVSINELGILEVWLREVAGHKVEIVVPSRGLRRRLLRIAHSNALAKFEEVGKKLKLENKFAVEGLAQLQKILKSEKTIKRIEAYDISNTQGVDSVGAMVVFENGQMQNQQYRRFRIKKVNGPDDYASLKEVLSRRFSKSKKTKDWVFPEVVLIDGGKGQINAVAEEVPKGIKLLGMAKGDHSAPKAKDEVWLHGVSKPLDLPKNSPGKYLLQQIRDEVHRFAIAYHTNIRRKQMRNSALEKVPGVGVATRKKLIKKFGSLAGVQRASVSDIEEIVGKKKARDIKNLL